MAAAKRAEGPPGWGAGQPGVGEGLAQLGEGRAGADGGGVGHRLFDAGATGQGDGDQVEVGRQGVAVARAVFGRGAAQRPDRHDQAGAAQPHPGQGGGGPAQVDPGQGQQRREDQRQGQPDDGEGGLLGEVGLHGAPGGGQVPAHPGGG